MKFVIISVNKIIKLLTINIFYGNKNSYQKKSINEKKLNYLKKVNSQNKLLGKYYKSF